VVNQQRKEQSEDVDEELTISDLTRICILLFLIIYIKKKYLYIYIYIHVYICKCALHLR